MTTQHKLQQLYAGFATASSQRQTRGDGTPRHTATEVTSTQEPKLKYMQILLLLPQPLDNKNLLDLHQPE